MKKILLILFLIFLIPSVSALGIERVEFFEVEQGSSQTIEIDVYTSPGELENEFTYEILSSDQKVHEWITVSPEKFIMPPGEQRHPITVSLTIPITAELGDYSGELKYAGSRVSGGGTIGYTVATKSVLHFKVVKEGAKKKIDFVTLDVNSYIKPNEIAKFSSTMKNTGNVPIDFYTSLIIEDKESHEEVFKADSAPMNMGVGLFEEVTLYWEPEEEGNYTAHFKIIFDDSADDVSAYPFKSKEIAIFVSNQVPASQYSGFSTDFMSDPLTILGILFIIVAAVFIVLTVKPVKKYKEKDNKDSENKKDV